MTGTAACTHAREWVSLRLDGELSDFEGFLLDAHLARCEACCSFEAHARTSTTVLRGVPLESFSRPLYLPRRRHRPVKSVQLALAAAGVGLLVLAVNLTSMRSTRPTFRVQRPDAAAALREEPYLDTKPCLLEPRAGKAHHEAAQYCV